MITLVKFLTTIAILCGIVFAVIFSLATFVSPGSRDMGFTVPPSQMMQPPK